MQENELSYRLIIATKSTSNTLLTYGKAFSVSAASITAYRLSTLILKL